MTEREEFGILRRRYLSVVNSHEKRICPFPDMLRSGLGDCNRINHGIRIIPPPCPVRYGVAGASSLGQKGKNHARSDRGSVDRH